MTWWEQDKRAGSGIPTAEPGAVQAQGWWSDDPVVARGPKPYAGQPKNVVLPERGTIDQSTLDWMAANPDTQFDMTHLNSAIRVEDADPVSQALAAQVDHALATQPPPTDPAWDAIDQVDTAAMRRGLEGVLAEYGPEAVRQGVPLLRAGKTAELRTLLGNLDRDRSIQRRQETTDQTLRNVTPLLRPVAVGISNSGTTSASLLARVTDSAGLTDGLADYMLHESQALSDSRRRVNQGQVPVVLDEAIEGATRSLVDLFTLGSVIPGGKGAAAGAGFWQQALGRLSQARGFIAAFTAKSMNDAITEGKDAGLQGPKLWGYAVSQGAIEAGITSAFQMVGLGGLEKSLGQPVKAGVVQALRSAGISMLSELPEEIAITIFSDIARYLADVDPNALDQDRLVDGVIQTVATTLLTVGAANVPSVAGSFQRDRNVQPGTQQRQAPSAGSVANPLVAEQVRAEFEARMTRERSQPVEEANGSQAPSEPLPADPNTDPNGARPDPESPETPIDWFQGARVDDSTGVVQNEALGQPAAESDPMAGIRATPKAAENFHIAQTALADLGTDGTYSADDVVQYVGTMEGQAAAIRPIIGEGPFVVANVPIESLQLAVTQESDVDQGKLADAMDFLEAGSAVPPVVAGMMGADLVVADGTHRVMAARQAGKTTIPAVVPLAYAKARRMPHSGQEEIGGPITPGMDVLDVAPEDALADVEEATRAQLDEAGDSLAADPSKPDPEMSEVEEVTREQIAELEGEETGQATQGQATKPMMRGISRPESRVQGEPAAEEDQGQPQPVQGLQGDELGSDAEVVENPSAKDIRSMFREVSKRFRANPYSGDEVMLRGLATRDGKIRVWAGDTSLLHPDMLYKLPAKMRVDAIPIEIYEEGHVRISPTWTDIYTAEGGLPDIKSMIADLQGNAGAREALGTALDDVIEPDDAGAYDDDPFDEETGMLRDRTAAKAAPGQPDPVVERGKREWRRNAPTQTANPTPTATHFLRRVPVPELVEFYRALTGKFPKVNGRLRNILGYFDPANATLGMNPIMARDERALAKTLAHEIGHLVDWLPQRAIYGNPLLAKLSNLQTMTRRALEQLKGTREAEVRAELLLLSHRWREPIDPATQPVDHVAYRMSSPELYADFVSVLLNDPALAKQMAPKAFAIWMEDINRKPEVMAAYLEINDLLAGTPEDLLKARSARVQEWFDRTDNALQSALAEREAARQSFGSALKQTFLDSGSPAIQTVKESPGGNHKAVEWALGEFALLDQEASLAVSNLERKVMKPLVDAKLDREVFREWVMMNRIANGDRAQYINPGGFTRKEARRQLAYLQKSMNPDQKAALKQAVKAYMDIGYDLATKLYQEGAYSGQLYQRITENRGNYSVFTPLEYVVDKSSWSVKDQIGTFKPIGDPLTMTTMKYMAMARMYEVQKARNVVIRELQKADQDVVIKKITPYAKPPQADENSAVIMHWIGGKPHWVKMHRMFADAFKRTDIGSLSRFARFLNTASYTGFHQLYVTMNLGWMVMNLPRDIQAGIKGTMANVYRKHGITTAVGSVPKLLKAYVQTAPGALRHARGKYDSMADRMMENRALASLKVADVLRTREQAEYEVLWTKHFGKPEDSKSKVADAIGRMYDVFVVAANFTESWSKMAANRTLEDMGFRGRELARIVRDDVGTPNIYTKGLATGLTNAAFMYQKVALNGWRRDIRMATDAKTAPGWWMGWMMTSGLGKLAMIGAAWGLFGDELREYFESISEYDKTNYICIPLPWSRNEDGVIGYLRLPDDHTSRILNGILWKLSQAMSAEDRYTLERALKETFAFGKSQVPGLSTILDIPSAWTQYLSGANPQDDWTRRAIISRDAYQAGGLPALREMASWTAGQFGVLSDIIKPLVGDHWEPRHKAPIEEAVAWLPGLNRVVRYSDRGLREDAWAREHAEEAESARFRLSLPEEARRLLRRRYELTRFATGGNQEELSLAQRRQKAALDSFYSTYLDVTEAIKAAERAGNTEASQRLRQRLESLAVRYAEIAGLE